MFLDSRFPACAGRRGNDKTKFMKIGIDTRPLANLSATRGIGVYTSHLVRYLKKMGVEVVEVKEGRVPEGVSLIHYPFFDLYFPTLPLIKKLPTVVTIHDVTPLVLPELYPPGIKGRIWFRLQKWSLGGVRGIITDSEVSKRDIVEQLGILKEKVETVYLAPQDGLGETPTEKTMTVVKEKYRLPEQFVLYVGDVNMNKNLISLVRACKQVELPIAIVGKQAAASNAVGTESNSVGSIDKIGATSNVAEKIGKNINAEQIDLVRLKQEFGNDPKVLRLGYVPIEELGAVYRHASLYCQPSLYEGFGVSMLEAMTCGCPVVATKRGSLMEIGGKAAVYTEPEMEKLAKAIQFVIQLSPTQRKRLVQEGHKQAERFSWEQTAQQTYAVYKRAVGQEVR